MEIEIAAKNLFLHLNVIVIYKIKDRENSTFKQFYRLIIEVLSDSTEAFDRENEFADYALLPSLQEYALINIERARIKCFHLTYKGYYCCNFMN